VALHISLVGRRDLSTEIFRQVRDAILAGVFNPGDLLPSSREMARTLSVSRMTVTVAYERLESEGFTTARARTGVYVSDTVETVRRTDATEGPRGVLVPQRMWQSIDLPKPFANPPPFNFRTGTIDPTLFPLRVWRGIVTRTLRSHASLIGTYGDHAGHHELRLAIARHIAISRGMQTSAEDVTVTSGAQQAIDVLARVLMKSGDRVALEDPGYPPVRRLFQSLGFRVCGVDVDDEGLVVDVIPLGVRVVYVTPSHQYPLGVAMTLRRRQALLEWAHRRGAAIIEDDYDSEFRFGGRPLEPLRTLDTAGRVIYVGSFSKALLPGLRLGFIVAPRSLRASIHKAKSVMDWHTSTLEQLALARFLDEGVLATHVRQSKRVYGQRHDLILDLLTRNFADHLQPIPSVTGLHVCALARRLTVRNLGSITERALAVGVGVQSLSFFAVGENQRAGIVLGYGGIPTKRIEEGLRRLRRCFEARP
jgi:GntR family transcriptional regulator / MocR family aminotransferase